MRHFMVLKGLSIKTNWTYQFGLIASARAQPCNAGTGHNYKRKMMNMARMCDVQDGN